MLASLSQQVAAELWQRAWRLFVDVKHPMSRRPPLAVRNLRPQQEAAHSPGSDAAQKPFSRESSLSFACMGSE